MSNPVQPGPLPAAPLRRAVTIDEMREKLSHLISPEGLRRGLAYRPRPTDLFVATYPKCGTTWMQQIVHGLRSRGSMDFEEITAAVPWIETAHDMGIDVEAPQVAEPRAFKTHCQWQEVPKGGRYLYVIRDPGDVLVSFYHFFEGRFFEPGTISLEAFALEFFLSGSRSGRYWDHLVGWWRQREREEVRFFCFEDMKRDLEGTVREVARFMGLDADEALVALATRQASFEFMHAHQRQFDDHLLHLARHQACGLPPESASSKVRTGRVGNHARELPATVIAVLDARWREDIEDVLGFRSYADLRAAVAAMRGR